MIKTDKEYRECIRKLEEDRQFIDSERQALINEGLNETEIARALEANLSFHEQLKDEAIWYERVKRREFGVIENLSDLGRILIALRIANGITQRELAERLGVDESQVSRDERNEYHGVTLERAQRIIETLGEKLVAKIEDKPDRLRSVQAIA